CVLQLLLRCRSMRERHGCFAKHRLSLLQFTDLQIAFANGVLQLASKVRFVLKIGSDACGCVIQNLAQHIRVTSTRVRRLGALEKLAENVRKRSALRGGGLWS